MMSLRVMTYNILEVIQAVRLACDHCPVMTEFDLSGQGESIHPMEE